MLEPAANVCWLMRADVDRELCLVWQEQALAAIPKMKPCERCSFREDFLNSFQLLQPFFDLPCVNKPASSETRSLRGRKKNTPSDIYG